jgi:exodeoxyribonuclease VII large subunit
MTEESIYERIFTVGEITDQIREIILESFFNYIWVKGEVSNLTKHTSGHTYFSLKDERAIIRCVIFKNLSHKRQGLEEGTEIAVFGKVDIYPKGSTYQLIIHDWQPLGLGFYSKIFEEVKEKLRNKGYFDEAKKKKLPFYISRVGIATSRTGAALRDIIRIIWRRNPYTSIILSPCSVQGEGAAESIAHAIELLNEYADIDVIITGRWGGSVEDLWSFNEIIVADAIYNSEIPVVSAVGHEVDYTIADFTADLRAPTPSTAGEIVSREISTLKKDLLDFSKTINYLTTHQLKVMSDEISHLSNHRNFIYPFSFVEDEIQGLDKLQSEFLDLIKGYIEKEVESLKILRDDILTFGDELVAENEDIINSLENDIKKLDYKNTLLRGFAIIEDEAGDIISTIKDTERGAELSSILQDGIIKSKVEDIINEE